MTKGESDNNQAESRAPKQGYGLFDLLWAAILDIPRLMRTVKFAIWVIIILALFTLAGTILPQEHLSGDPVAFGQQYAAMFRLNPDDGRTTFGEFLYHYLVVPLELYRVFRSGLYFVLLAVLAISAALCSWDRFLIARKVLGRTRPVTKPVVIKALAHSSEGEAACDVESARKRVREALERRRFQVFESTDEDGATWFFVRKNAIRHAASVTFHLALLIILVGGIIGDERVLGYSGGMKLAEGEKKALGSEIERYKRAQAAGQEFVAHSEDYIELVDYENIYREEDFPGVDPDSGFPIGYTGMPSDYISHLRIIRPNDDGEQVLAERAIEVNFPLRYGGVAYYQSAFDLDLHLTVTTPDQGSIPLTASLNQPFIIPGLDLLSVITPADVAGGVWQALDGSSTDLPYVVGLRSYGTRSSASATRPILLGYVSEAKPLPVGDAEIRLDGVDEYTVLQYVRDPGVPIVYLGGFLLMIGLTVALYMPYRFGRIMLRAHPALGGRDGTEYIVGGSFRDFPGLVEAALKD
jgi:cytochrome c biogenesis protein